MKKEKINDDPLVGQIAQRIREIDGQLELLKGQRYAATQMLAALSNQRIEPQEKTKRRVKRSSSKNAVIFETLAQLVKANQRPVNVDEILQALPDAGVSIGRTEARRRSYLGAVFSNELKKSEPRIIRSDRGTYDIRR